MPTEKHFTGKIAVKALIVKDGKVLVLRAKEDGDKWDIPGGRVHIGEDLETALKREVQEELGADINIGPLLSSVQIIHTGEGTPHMFLTYQVTLINPEQSLKIDQLEAEEYLWVDEQSFKEIKVYDSCVEAFKKYWSK